MVKNFYSNNVIENINSKTLFLKKYRNCPKYVNFTTQGDIFSDYFPFS